MPRKRTSSPAKSQPQSPLNSGEWTVEVRPLSTDNYEAGIVELPACVGEGPTRAAAVEKLESALEHFVQAAAAGGEELPIPIERRASGRLSIRLSRTLHERLVLRAARERLSLNALILSVLSAYVVGDSPDVRSPADLPHAGYEVRSMIGNSEEALRAALQSIYDLEARGATNLGLLLRALVADRVHAIRNAHEASRLLGQSARKAEDAGHSALAEAFWRESLNVEPTNPISTAAFGEFLFERGRFGEAIPHLEDAELAWSKVQLQWCKLREAASRTTREDAAKALIDELKKSVARKMGLTDRRTWLRHIQMLVEAEAVTERQITDLVQRANVYGEWPELDANEVLGRREDDEPA